MGSTSLSFFRAFGTFSAPILLHVPSLRFFFSFFVCVCVFSLATLSLPFILCYRVAAPTARWLVIPLAVSPRAAFVGCPFLFVVVVVAVLVFFFFFFFFFFRLCHACGVLVLLDTQAYIATTIVLNLEAK